MTDGVAKTGRHTTFYLDAGAPDAPLIVLVHGWPELSLSWRHQLPCFADLGFRAVAPDMRGYGGSSVYPRHEDYALEVIVEVVFHPQNNYVGVPLIDVLLVPLDTRATEMPATAEIVATEMTAKCPSKYEAAPPLAVPSQ